MFFYLHQRYVTFAMDGKESTPGRVEVLELADSGPTAIDELSQFHVQNATCFDPVRCNTIY